MSRNTLSGASRLLHTRVAAVNRVRALAQPLPPARSACLPFAGLIFLPPQALVLASPPQEASRP